MAIRIIEGQPIQFVQKVTGESAYFVVRFVKKEGSASEYVAGGSEDNAADEDSAHSGVGNATGKKGETEAAKFKVCCSALQLCEIRNLIATSLAKVTSSPATLVPDINNLRLASKTWNNTIIQECPEVKQLLFQLPKSTVGLPFFVWPESPHMPMSRGNLLLAERYRTSDGQYLAIHSRAVDFNTVFKHILFRFQSQVPGANPRVNDTVNIKLGHARGANSYWMTLSNQRAFPHIIPRIIDSDESKVEINVRNSHNSKFGRAICDQFVTQPPVYSIRVTFRAETHMLNGKKRRILEVIEPTGVRVWHVLQALLDILVPDGSATDLSDLYELPSVANEDEGLENLPPLPDDVDEDLHEPAVVSSDSC
ncbi:hypothetical protein JOL62DRAFT_631750 [Phyllosticta paracitricarpa]|uniref:Uncharacterized protein n=1 Tax=Phyllosticta paracitricarpa TaxID=2016321 RepID=A0ABR1MTU1_9PEZI